MATQPRADEIEGQDEEFLFHLNRGSEVLARGDAEAARTSLERALELRPKDSKVLGLLGQAYYKLARYDEAGKVWQKLVDDNPVEPSARVNLGLARLKGKKYPDAVKQLEIALDLNPEHKKAMGYLGLALLESGEPARAKEWFKKAGSDQMVARCDEVIAGKASAPLKEAEAPAPEVMPVAAAKPPAPPPPPPRPAVEAGVLATWAAGRVISAAANAQTFVLMGEVLAVTVKGEVRIRLDGLFATRGKLTLSGEVKRFRGRPTEKPFGEGAWRMHLASGEGTLLVRSPGRKFTVLDLGSEAAYFREEVLFGFEDALAFENGRVPSSIAVDLNLVHLRGNGNFLLATGGNPVAIDVTVDAPLKLPLEALVGWVGGLTPKVSLLSEEDPTTAAVELTGEGRVLADPGAGWGDLP